MTHARPTHPPPARPSFEEGQVLVLTLVVGLGLLAILGLVADGGLLFARHRELQALADAAARSGAGQLDEAAYRASGGRTAQLDPTQARAAAARHLRAAGFTGQATITATTGQVTVGLAERIRTPIFNNVGFSPIRLAVRTRAEPRTGSAQPKDPDPMPTRRLLAATLLAVLLAGCGDDGTPASPTATTAVATPTTSAAPPTTLSATAELLAAYDRSWRVYADALRRLDPTRLPTAFAGSALRAAQQEVATQKANNQPVRIKVEHRARVLRVTATDGLVEDHYRNHSVVLDPTSGAPAEPDPNEVVYQRQSLKRVDGTWKVVEVIEEQRP